MKQLDRKRPFGTVHGDPDVFFKQDGYDFDNHGNVIGGSGPKDATVETVASAVEALADAAGDSAGEDVPVELPALTLEQMASKSNFLTLHVSQLRKMVLLKYEELNATDTPYTEVEAGSGMAGRCAEFLARYSV